MSAAPSHDVARDDDDRLSDDKGADDKVPDVPEADDPAPARSPATLPLPNALAYAIAVLALIVAVIQPFAVLAKGLTLAEAVDGFFLQNGVAFALLGALILRRRPGHVIGWLLIFAGGLDALTHVGDEYELFELNEAPGFPSVAGVEAVIGWFWVPTVAMIGMALPQLFPDGRLLSRRWRPLAWLGAAATALLSTLFILDPAGLELSLFDFAFPLFGLSMLASLVPLVLRYRRSTGVERQQLKWVFYGLAVCVPLIVVGTAGTFWGASAAWSLPALLILPVTITVAVLRYRLFDIDVVISRTLLVAGLAAFITAAYVGIVVGVGSLVGQGDEPNLALSVLATAVVAVAFQPVRRGLQRVANRLVFGRRATPYDVLSGFATRVGAAEPSADTLVHLAELMANGTGADPARVWLRVGEELRPAATWPGASDGAEQPVPIPVDAVRDLSDDTVQEIRLPGADLAVPVRDRGELLGMLTIAKPRGERVGEVDVEMLGRLAAASGVVLRNLRLDAELAQRLMDLEASRRRLLTAQNDARQRIEEDLAGGSRGQLEQLRGRLGQLADEVDPGAAPKTAVLLGQLVSATDAALQTLDGLAAGVYPPRLAAEGLAAALSEQAERAALPVSVQATDTGRYPAEVEAAVYFSVLEALQNVAKYAGADSAAVVLTDDGDRLRFQVIDNGAGFDPATTSMGTGLQGMADRLDTVGGAMTVHSAPGNGTTITGHVPAARLDTAPRTPTPAEPALAQASR
ncbi:MAG: hypothetical protein M3443_09090 [Actinomycetota bacterium]|nr:hypothetical protein [Actinomycetota bacterium]